MPFGCRINRRFRRRALYPFQAPTTLPGVGLLLPHWSLVMGGSFVPIITHIVLIYAGLVSELISVVQDSDLLASLGVDVYYGYYLVKTWEVVVYGVICFWLW